MVILGLKNLQIEFPKHLQTLDFKSNNKKIKAIELIADAWDQTEYDE